LIVCNICGAIFFDIGEKGRAEKVYKEHLKYCEPIRKKKSLRRKDEKLLHPFRRWKMAKG